MALKKEKTSLLSTWKGWEMSLAAFNGALNDHNLWSQKRGEGKKGGRREAARMGNH